LARIKKPCSHEEKAKEKDLRLLHKTLEGIWSISNLSIFQLRSFSSFKMIILNKFKQNHTHMWLVYIVFHVAHLFWIAFNSKSMIGFKRALYFRVCCCNFVKLPYSACVMKLWSSMYTLHRLQITSLNS
jgi:hypothetical protein